MSEHEHLELFGSVNSIGALLWGEDQHEAQLWRVRLSDQERRARDYVINGDFRIPKAKTFISDSALNLTGFAKSEVQVERERLYNMLKRGLDSEDCPTCIDMSVRHWLEVEFPEFATVSADGESTDSAGK